MGRAWRKRRHEYSRCDSLSRRISPRQTGACVPRLYKAVDIICIWLAFITVFAYSRQRFAARESALACLYYAAIVPLTFALHFYHLYDRARLLA
jgi:hypothetical protein